MAKSQRMVVMHKLSSSGCQGGEMWVERCGFWMNSLLKCWISIEDSTLSLMSIMFARGIYGGRICSKTHHSWHSMMKCGHSWIGGNQICWGQQMRASSLLIPENYEPSSFPLKLKIKIKIQSGLLDYIPRGDCQAILFTFYSRLDTI